MTAASFGELADDALGRELLAVEMLADGVGEPVMIVMSGVLV